jgi:hypothetical protein
MQVNREVIQDLLPVYLAGEASEATKALVEEYMRGDPEFAALVRAEGQVKLAALAGGPSPETELVALKSARRLIRWRSWTLAAAIFFTLLPFSFVYSQNSIRWSMWSTMPEMSMFLLAGASIFWLVLWRLDKRLRGL